MNTLEAMKGKDLIKFIKPETNYFVQETLNDYGYPTKWVCVPVAFANACKETEIPDDSKVSVPKPKFKVGDVVIDTNGTLICLTEEPMYKDFIGKEIKEATAWRLATPEEIAKWNEETLQPSHLHYDSKQRKIIHWFLPFDKIIARAETDMWCLDLFSRYARLQDFPYRGMGDMEYEECLPYNEKTKHLIGTTDDYEEE